MRFADRALALADDDERLAALELRGRSFHAAVRGDEALAAYVEAIAAARATGDRAAASRLRWKGSRGCRSTRATGTPPSSAAAICTRPR